MPMRPSPIPPPRLLLLLFLPRLLGLLPIKPPPRLNRNLISPRPIRVRRRQPQRLGHGLLLRQLHLAHLLSLLLLRALLVLGVPRQVPPLLPPPHGRLEAVAQVVLPVCRVGDLIPGEVYAAAGSGLADARDEVHACVLVRGFVWTGVFDGMWCGVWRYCRQGVLALEIFVSSAIRRLAGSRRRVVVVTVMGAFVDVKSRLRS